MLFGQGDQLTRQGLSRSSIAQLVSLASGIYAWAAAPSRRLVQRNPLRLVELPPNDEKPRMRVALAPDAAELLAPLEPPRDERQQRGAGGADGGGPPVRRELVEGGR